MYKSNNISDCLYSNQRVIVFHREEKPSGGFLNTSMTAMETVINTGGD